MSLGTKTFAVRQTLVTQEIMADGEIDPGDPKDVETSFLEISRYLDRRLHTVLWMTRETLQGCLKVSNFPLDYKPATSHDKLSGIEGFIGDAPVIVDDSVPLLERKWKPLEYKKVLLLQASKDDYDLLCGPRRR